MYTQDILANEWTKSEFPLYFDKDFDYSFTHAGYDIGFSSDLPADLVERLGAAVVSYRLGYAGIDRLYKERKEVKKNVSNDRLESNGRFDKELTRWVNKNIDFIDNICVIISEHDDPTLGTILFEWTVLRSRFCIKQSLSLAHRGTIFELAAVLRVLLEQWAWAVTVDGISEVERVDAVSATRSINNLKRVFRDSGLLYNLLSQYSHWSKNRHTEIMVFFEKGLGVLYASSLFKARGFALIVLFVYVWIEIISIKRSYAISNNERLRDWSAFALLTKRECQALLEKLIAGTQDDFIRKLPRLEV